jgi:hypothetical protein
MTTEWQDVVPLEWTPFSRPLRVACCDCGLVHEIDFKVEDGKEYVKFRRDNRTTGQLRRWRRRPTDD